MAVILEITPRKVGHQDEGARNDQAGPRKRSGSAIEV
jgi:hypothetical protein